MEISETPSQLCIIYLEIAFHKDNQDYDIQIFLQYHLARAPDLQSHRIQEQLKLLISQPAFLNL